MGIFKNDDQKSSQFGFDEKSMAGKAVKAVRWIYAITGVVALLAGIALLFAPAKSLIFLTTVLGFYFVITAAIRLFTAIFEPLLPTGWRVTSIISNLLIILGGVIILRNQAFSTATLTRSWWSLPALAGSLRASCRFWSPNFRPTAPSPS